MPIVRNCFKAAISDCLAVYPLHGHILKWNFLIIPFLVEASWYFYVASQFKTTNQTKKLFLVFKIY